MSSENSNALWSATSEDRKFQTEPNSALTCQRNKTNLFKELEKSNALQSATSEDRKFHTEPNSAPTDHRNKTNLFIEFQTLYRALQL